MQSIDDREHRAREFSTSHGFAPCRHFVRMLIEMTSRPPQPEWPAGIAVRAVNSHIDLVAGFRAGRDAFKDHWGHVETPFDEALARLRHRIANDPDLDPTLRFIAEWGDEIVAVCNASPRDGSDASTGYIETDRRPTSLAAPWAGTGVPTPCLPDALYDRGVMKVALRVDAESLTGATQLYEKAGMKVDELNPRVRE